MKFKGIEFNKLKHFSLMIIPEDTSIQSYSKKVNLNSVLLIILTYTFIAGFFGFLFFSFTPMHEWIFPGSVGFSSNDRYIIKDLNERMLFLSKELEEIKSTNSKLKNALKLGDSSLFKEKESKKSKAGGNLYQVVLDFVKKFNLIQRENITFINPATGFISRTFLPDKGHMGIDYVLKSGTPVYAAANGYVVFSGETIKDGNMIIVAHPGNYLSLYKHCSSLLKKERDVLFQGELIALSGNSGESTTGSHLHFEIWSNGKPIDPMKIILKKKEVQ